VFVFVSLGNELKYAEHVTMVSNGQCRHVIGGSLFVKLTDLGRSVEQ
jgi:hypothetical protein